MAETCGELTRRLRSPRSRSGAERTAARRSDVSGAGYAMAQEPTGQARQANLGRRARTLAACAALAVSALGLGGCAAAREELGTAASGCFVDLAMASHAVHDRGRLRGVRLVSVASLSAHAPLLFNAAEMEGRRLAQVCLVAF